MSARTVDLLETRIGQPRVIGQRRDHTRIWSSIHRQPALHRELYLTWTGLAGDQPTETRPKTAVEGGSGQIHGGNDKAVYVYPADHYAAWLDELGEDALSNRSFGENLRITGVCETDVHIGDVWDWGEARVVVSKPRQPCQTLVSYFDGLPMIKSMIANGRCGWYLRVERPGIVPTSGRHAISVVSQNLSGATVAAAFAAKFDHTK